MRLPSATSSSGSDAPSWSPKRTTSSPTPASGTGVRSTIVRSIVTRPTIGTRRPRTSIWPRFESSQE